MTNEQQALLDMPIWLVIVLALVGGVSGEMWRADKEGARGWSLLRRLALRSGACMVCGVSAIMLLYAAGVSIWTACAFGCLTAMVQKVELGLATPAEEAALLEYKQFFIAMSNVNKQPGYR